MYTSTRAFFTHAENCALAPHNRLNRFLLLRGVAARLHSTMADLSKSGESARQYSQYLARGSPKSWFQKSVTRPEWLQSLCRTGSLFGPPCSPVNGFTSPWNSGAGVRRASGCASSPALTLGAVPVDWDSMDSAVVDFAAGREAALTSSSNSRCSFGANGMGPGRDIGGG